MELTEPALFKVFLGSRALVWQAATQPFVIGKSRPALQPQYPCLGSIRTRVLAF